jgi:uncharacterized protein YbjT (DUF2867 family)
MTDFTEQGITLVLGGTGKTGRHLVTRLTGRDLPVRIGSRSGGVPFDWADRSTWTAALQGVRAVYISYYPDLAVPGAADTIGAFAQLAVDSGARRLVLLSGRGEDEAAACEKTLAAAGADWTVLRCSWFAQNFSEGHLREPVLGGEVALPAGPVGEPFVDTRDIADVAAAVLTEDGRVGETYELTGPRLLTFAGAVAEIAAATGRPIVFTRVPMAEYAAALAAAQVPADVIELLTYLFTTVLDGRNAQPGGGVQRVLGRAPRDFGTYARETAATGVWNKE